MTNSKLLVFELNFGCHSERSENLSPFLWITISTRELTMGYGMRGGTEQETFRVTHNLERTLYSAFTGPNCTYFLGF